MDNCNHSRNVTIYADWQIWGDVDPAEHVAELLEKARANADVTDWEILGTSTDGPLGLMFITFKVLADFQFNDLQKPKKAAKKMLNLALGDTDVSVRWVERS